MPDGKHEDAVHDLLEYFDTTYLSGSLRTVRRPGTTTTVRDWEFDFTN